MKKLVKDMTDEQLNNMVALAIVNIERGILRARIDARAGYTHNNNMKVLNEVDQAVLDKLDILHLGLKVAGA